MLTRCAAQKAIQASLSLSIFLAFLHAVESKNNAKHMKKCMYFLFQASGGVMCWHHELRSHEDGKPHILKVASSRSMASGRMSRIGSSEGFVAMMSVQTFLVSFVTNGLLPSTQSHSACTQLSRWRCLTLKNTSYIL